MPRVNRAIDLPRSAERAQGLEDRARIAQNVAQRVYERLSATPGARSEARFARARVRETMRNPFDYGDDLA